MSADTTSSSDEKPVEAQAKSRTRDLLAYSQRQVDRIVSPPTRQRAMESSQAFASERPVLAALIVTQASLAAFPILFFLGFALSTLTFATLSALAFTFFWVGLALLFLIPTLLVTSGLGLLVWLWVVGSYLTGRWAYNKLPVSVRGDVQVDGPGGKSVIFHKQISGEHGEQSYAAVLDKAIKEEAAEVRD
ncbi:hypothetical protein F5Y18DRAFT_398956 [Xylariaceae sp. FL1019]|nr:hypothetical protein F5Y18DRAFT_398956 [Xylariaceae sp. FL1019]